MTSRPSLTSRLLVPLDGSALAEQALPYARTLAGPSTDIDLVHVIQEPESRYGVNDEMVLPIGSAVNTAMNEATEALNHAVTAWGLPADRTHVEVIIGEPTTTLLRAAAAWESTLIVLASYGQSGRWHYGSVTDRLVRRARIPVLVIHPDGTSSTQGRQPVRLARFIVPLDGSARAERALPVAGELARQLQLPVKLVRVAAPSHSDPEVDIVRPRGGSEPVLPHFSPEAELNVIAAARSYLKQAANHPSLRGTLAMTNVLIGEPAPVLLDQADPTGLIILTSHGCGGIPPWLLGSVAEPIVRQATAPVLVVPDARRADTDPEADDAVRWRSHIGAGTPGEETVQPKCCSLHIEEV